MVQNVFDLIDKQDQPKNLDDMLSNNMGGYSGDIMRPETE